MGQNKIKGSLPERLPFGYTKKGSLHHKIQRQRQKCVVSVFFAVTCHQQKQQDDDQIPSVKIFRQKLSQKTTGRMGNRPRRPWLRLRRLWGAGRRDWRRAWLGPRWPRFRWPGFWYSVAPIAAVWLWYIAIVHTRHLPAGEAPRNAVAMPAIRAARMACSSF